MSSPAKDHRCLRHLFYLQMDIFRDLTDGKVDSVLTGHRQVSKVTSLLQKLLFDVVVDGGVEPQGAAVGSLTIKMGGGGLWWILRWLQFLTLPLDVTKSYTLPLFNIQAAAGSFSLA